MKAELIDHMGDDRTVVNAARVSFNKEVREFRDKDAKLINYLAEHEHWSPFAHPQLSFRCEAPIFVARQLVKHQVGLTWNEVSRRYVDEEPKFYIPPEWRSRPLNKKQGSSDAIFVDWDFDSWEALVRKQYQRLLGMGVAPEQARIILPLNTYTSWIWTGSLYAFIRVCKLRLQPDAQAETQEFARCIAKEVKLLFPVSWAAFFPEEEKIDG